MLALEALGPEATTSPYGMGGSIKGPDVPTYDVAYFMLPEGCTMTARGRRTIEASNTMRLERLDEGDYATINYDGPWKEIGSSYDMLRSYLVENGLSSNGRFFETSLGGFMDLDLEKRYRCRIETRVDV